LRVRRRSRVAVIAGMLIGGAGAALAWLPAAHVRTRVRGRAYSTHVRLLNPSDWGFGSSIGCRTGCGGCVVKHGVFAVATEPEWIEYCL